jgi:hypothetical protein
MTGFSFRWGIDLFDDERTPIPNWILTNYHQIEWQGADGEGNPISGIGVSNTEMMFIIHLASFRYETENGQASPSLTGTIADRMNYTSNQGIINVEEKLVNKGLLLVEKRPGQTSIYDFTPFSEAIIKAIMQNNPSTKIDDPQSTKIDDLPEESSTKVDESRQQKLTRRKEEKENSKDEEGEDKKEIDFSSLPTALDAHQRAVDQANGGDKQNPVDLITQSYYGGYMGGPVPLPTGKKERGRWENMGQRLASRFPPETLKDVMTLCYWIERWHHSDVDRFWKDKPDADTTLDNCAKYVVNRLRNKPDLAPSHDLAQPSEPDPLASWWQLQLAMLNPAWSAAKPVSKENGKLVVRISQPGPRAHLSLSSRLEAAIRAMDGVQELEVIA